MKLKLLVIALLLLSNSLIAQVFTNKEVGKKNQSKIDSLKSTDYPYSLPIWGDKATKAGYTLPYSAGFSLQYVGQKSDLVMNNLQVGFNNGELINLDGLVVFNKAESSSSGVNVRPDIWIFPFLNIYGILAKINSSTAIDISINVPNGTSSSEILSLATQADFQGTTAGFGLTPTIGVGGGWIALDMNFSWTDIDALEKPAFAYVFGPRFGKTINLKKPDQSVNFWVGGFRLKLNSGTKGSLAFSDILSFEEADDKINNGFMKVEEAQQNLDNWWEGLTQAEQKLNQGVYDRAYNGLNRVNEVLTSASGAVDNIENSTVQYSLDKKPKDLWNFVVGSQFQFNRHWMIRAEYGFLGSRNQFIGGLQYRFGL